MAAMASVDDKCNKRRANRVNGRANGWAGDGRGGEVLVR